MSRPTLFGSTSTIRRYGERFRDGMYKLVSFLFAVILLAAAGRAQPFQKSGGGTSPRGVRGINLLYSTCLCPRNWP